MLVYFNGRYMLKAEVTISPDDRGFLFGDGVYEVMHVYRGKLFRPDDHMTRLQRSLAGLRLGGVDVNEIRGVAETLIERNGLSGPEASIYIQVTRGAAPQRQHGFPDATVPPTVYAAARPYERALAHQRKGVRVILVPDLRWLRCDIKTIALVANVCATQQALESGAHEAILIRDGRVTEGSHTSVLAVIDGCVVTHPLNHLILDGVTRRVTLELCRELGIGVEERSISKAELLGAQEIMLTGTTSEIEPVVVVDESPVGSGLPGPVTQRLQEAYHELTAAL